MNEFVCVQLHNGIPKIAGFDVAQTMDDHTKSLDDVVGTYNWMAPGMTSPLPPFPLQILTTNNRFCTQRS
jgi:hypothetical protein